jgi:hypothetical protein
MRQAFVFEKVAVVVGPWFEPGEAAGLPPERSERGARVEVRLLAAEPPRGTRSAAQRVVVDLPVFRADLFDRLDAAPGNLRSAHFHPWFDGVEPCDRHWPDGIRSDPVGWLATELGDLERLLARGGVADGDGDSFARDAVALREAIPSVTAAVEDAWRAARAAPAQADAPGVTTPHS